MTPRTLRRGLRAAALASLFSAAAALSAAPTARAEEPKQECATLLEKSSSFARFDATYPQARADLGECAAGRCSGNRALVDVCKAQLKRLDDAVPVFVKIVGSKAASGGATVLVDGEAPAAPTVQGNRGYRLKAGPHVLLVKASGYPDVQRDINVDPNADEAARTFEVKLSPPAGAAPVAPPPTTAPASTAPPSTTDSPPPTDTASSGFPFRPIAVTVGIVGLLGVGAGFVAGSQAMSKRDEAGCDAQSRCATDAQTSTLLDAKNWGNASTILVVAGGALVATGVVLWLVAPSKSSTHVALTPSVGPGGGGLLARGTF